MADTVAAERVVNNLICCAYRVSATCLALLSRKVRLPAGGTSAVRGQ